MTDLTALRRIFAPGGESEPTPAPGAAPGDAEQPAPAELPVATSYSPVEAPECLPAADDSGELPAWRQAREERAAILEFEAGLSREQAKAEAARMHPAPETWHGFTRAELQARAHPDERADLAADPDALAAFAFALRLQAMRERGERPEHYTRAALCETCGPVWLFPGEAERVRACPWCVNTASGLPIPRPPADPAGAGGPFPDQRAKGRQMFSAAPVACSECRHWCPNSISPRGGLGSCQIQAPASGRPGSLWPRGEIYCNAWQPREGALHG
jgi:hypothetical protein